MEWQVYISLALNLLVFFTIILGVKANRDTIRHYVLAYEAAIESLKTRLKEHDMQIEMLCNRLKVQREESMAKALADATANPEKYLELPPSVQNAPMPVNLEFSLEDKT